MQKNIPIIIGVTGIIAIGVIGIYISGSELNVRQHLTNQTEKPIDVGMDIENIHTMEHMRVSNEREFIDRMIPHHQEAIDTANEILARGGEITEIKNLAIEIIKTQEKEIAEMKVWYADWFGEEYQDTGTYTNMMRDLSELTGRELDLVFAIDMIKHHQGALLMAQQALEFSKKGELIAMSNNILTTQQKEIEFMQYILSRENL